MTAFCDSAVLARVRQVGHALLARWTHHEDDALRVLSPRERALFEGLSPADRAHALRVADRLRRAGYDDDAGVTRDLLKAALLHDIGKAGQGVHLPHRIAHVVLRGLAPAWQAHIAAQRHGWHQPFFALAHHAELGAELLTGAGSDWLTISLVRYHDVALPPSLARYGALLTALRHADDAG